MRLLESKLWVKFTTIEAFGRIDAWFYFNEARGEGRGARGEGRGGE